MLSVDAVSQTSPLNRQAGPCVGIRCRTRDAVRHMGTAMRLAHGLNICNACAGRPILMREPHLSSFADAEPAEYPVEHVVGIHHSGDRAQFIQRGPHLRRHQLVTLPGPGQLEGPLQAQRGA
jgi:hypothetical protein